VGGFGWSKRHYWSSQGWGSDSPWDNTKTNLNLGLGLGGRGGRGWRGKYSKDGDNALQMRREEVILERTGTSPERSDVSVGPLPSMSRRRGGGSLAGARAPAAELRDVLRAVRRGACAPGERRQQWGHASQEPAPSPRRSGHPTHIPEETHNPSPQWGGVERGVACDPISEYRTNE